MRLKDRVERLEREVKVGYTSFKGGICHPCPTLKDNVQVLINKIDALEKYFGINLEFKPGSLQYEKIKQVKK